MTVGTRPGAVAATAAEAARFLFREAELLDIRRFDEWLALYAEDAIYSLPQDRDPDPVHKVGIVYDDRRRLAERVIRLKSGYAYSQEPASRTVHVIGNVQVIGQVEDCTDVHSSLMLTEVRRGRQAVYAALVRHLLRPADGSWLIAQKEIRLANSDVPLGNLTFLM